MITKSKLFSKGTWTRQAGLNDVLEAHKQKTIHTIKAISDLDQLNEDFLARLVKDSLVEPLVFDFAGMSFATRTEQIPAEWFPDNFNVTRGRNYPKTVARISIPFTGDRNLIEFTPNECTLNFPIGEVSGNKVQFDIILWGHSDDEQRAKQRIEENRAMIEMYARNSAKQVKAFNESLPEQVKAAFETKFTELSQQHSIFTGLGIKAEEKVEPFYSSATTTAPKKSRAREPKVIIQYVMNQYVEQLNQTNNNVGGDVNNAIQSNK